MSTPTNTPGTSVAAPAAGQVARQDFGGTELAVSGETAAAAGAAQAQAVVQARYVMALRRPRDWDDVRVRIMKAVERPGFADVAWYRKPIGAGVEGLSIRFAEEAIRCMGNLLPEAPIVYDSPTFRMLRVMLTDLESNITWSRDIVVDKTVERSKLRAGQVALQVRTNSAGATTYLVQATADEVASKEGSEISKVVRTHALRLLPGDIADAAKKRILAIRAGDVAKDPDGARRKVIDAFAGLNVLPSDIKRYLGHDVATASPAEIQDLRDLYSAIHEGTATWAEALAEKLGDEPEAAAPKKVGLDAVTEKLEQRAPAAASAPAPEASSAAPACAHPTVPPSRVAALPFGRSIVCPDCAAEIVNPDAAAPPQDRQPGEDDDVDAAAAVKALADKAGDTTKARPRSGRLQE